MSYKINNKELKQELTYYIDSCQFEWIKKDGKGNWKQKIRKRGKVSESLGQKLITIANGLATKGNWSGYTYKSDFISDAIYTMMMYMHNFDPKKYDNAHGYLNMICQNAFTQFVQKEHNHADTKQKLYNKKDELVFADNNNSAIKYEELNDELITEE